MRAIEGAIRYPVTTAVGVILVVLFGAIAIARIPVQLIPEVVKPEITVETRWPGASPLEAALLANYAGGVVVMKLGTATLTPDELREAVTSDPRLLRELTWARS